MIKIVKQITTLLSLLLINISIIANDSKAYFYKGCDLADQDKFEEAIKAFDMAIKYKPDFAKAYCNKGAALGKLRKFDEAIKAFNTAIKYDPEDSEAYFNKGLSLRNAGET